MQSKKIIALMTGALFVLVAVILVNTPAHLAPPEDVAGNESVEPDAAAHRLARSLQFRTLSAHGGLPPEAVPEFHRFQQFLRAEFPRTFATLQQEALESPTLLLHWKGRDESLAPMMLIAHQDVVPVEADSIGQWTHPPYSGVIEDGYIWGRGAIDNKGALLAILEAAESMIGKGYQPQRSIYFLFSHDEETERKGAAEAAARIEEKGERLHFVLDEGGLVIREALPGVRSRLAMVGISQKGYLTLTLSVPGSGGHSSMPPDDAAITILANALQRLTSQPFPADMRFLRPMLEAMAPELPLVQRVMLGNLWLTEPVVRSSLSAKTTQNAMMRTTIAPTMLTGSKQENVLPTLATATVNFRIFPGETIDSVVAGVKKRINDPRVGIDVGMAQEASPVSDTDSEAWQALVKTIELMEGDRPLHPVPGLTVAITDSSRFNHLSDSIFRFNHNEVGLPDIKGIHGIDERIALRSYREMIGFYRKLIGIIAGGAM